jgi:hypothetical protein
MLLDIIIAFSNRDGVSLLIISMQLYKDVFSDRSSNELPSFSIVLFSFCAVTASSGSKATSSSVVFFM